MEKPENNVASSSSLYMARQSREGNGPCIRWPGQTQKHENSWIEKTPRAQRTTVRWLSTGQVSTNYYKHVWQVLRARRGPPGRIKKQSPKVLLPRCIRWEGRKMSRSFLVSLSSMHPTNPAFLNLGHTGKPSRDFGKYTHESSMPLIPV